MIFMPTRGRPHNVKRFAEHYALTGAAEPVLLLLDGDDAHSYADLNLPPQFRCMAFDGQPGIVPLMNRAFETFPGEAFYALVGDDVIPRTPGWDAKLKGAAGPKGLAWGYDGGHAPHLPCHPFIGGDLVRAMGWLAYPGLKHFAADDVWLDIGLTLGSARYLPDVLLEHAHPAVGKARGDATYAARPDQRSDQEAYLRFHDDGEFLALVTRLTDVLFPESLAARKYAGDTSPATKQQANRRSHHG